jgi:copper oxidase (laccase) domain-containing protein
VAIGPCIAACCFEVGEDVAAHFPDYVIPPAPPARVDLINANRDQLAAAGVPSTQVESLDLCTVCNAVQFHSFRRERSDGRMVTAIRIRPAD